MGRLVGVVLQQGRPGLVEVLGDAPVVRRREVTDHPLQDPGGTVAEGLVVEDVGGGEQRLDRVHVGVDPAVGVEHGPPAVPLLHDHPGVVVPEALQEHLEREAEQLAGALPPRGRGAGGREHHEGVLVGGLVGGGRPVARDVGVPAAVHLVAEPTEQGGDAVVRQRRRTGTAEQVTQGVDVRHPAGDPELDRPVEVGDAVLTEPAEAPLGVPCGATEVEQPVPLRLQPAGVRRRAQPAHVAGLHLSPGVKVATPRVESLWP